VKIGIVCAGGNGNLGDELFLLRWQQLFAGHEVLQVTPQVNVNPFDRIIIGGGDLAQLDEYRSEIWHGPFCLKPCFVYGIGTSWFKKEEVCRQMAEFLNECRCVYARDPHSAKKLANLGVTISGVVRDLLWAIDLPKYEPSHTWQRTIGLALRHEHPTTEQQIKAVFSVAEKCSHVVRLMPLQTHGALGNDWWRHDRIARASASCPEYGGILWSNTPVLIQAAACGWPDLLVSTRIHASILALRAGKRVVPIYAGDPTGNRFSAICEQAGIQGIDSLTWGEKELLEAVEAAKPVSVTHLEDEARSQQLAFRDLVLGQSFR
jgi:polysaccharide pyruvyl transferase WcaK-like protein